MTYQTIDPTTEEFIHTYQTASEADIEHALAQAHACFTVWRTWSPEQRAAVMADLAQRVRSRADELTHIAVLEVGKLAREAAWEVDMCAQVFSYAATQGVKTLAASPVPGVPGAVLSHEPLGVLLAIEPWNYPYLQVARVIGPQLMAGNVLVVKHAENVPQCALALQGLFDGLDAPAGLYTNLFIGGKRADELIDDPRVQGVTVTGSERAGTAIAERAGRNLKKVVLELGGTDPFIVLEDAPLDVALDNAVFARMENTGQSCIAGKRFIVVGEARGKAFTEGMVARFKALRRGDLAAKETAFGPLCTKSALDTCLQQIRDAEAAGARVLTGGQRIDGPGFYLEPTVIDHITADNPIYQQEVFGPVASVYVVANEDDAVRLANDTPFGLGAAIFSADVQRATAIAHRVESGMVFINNPTWIAPNMPFGGVKRSGYGRELSELGFTEFVNKKLIRTFAPGTPVPA